MPKVASGLTTMTPQEHVITASPPAYKAAWGIVCNSKNGSVISASFISPPAYFKLTMKHQIIWR